MKRKTFKGRLSNKLKTEQPLWKGLYGIIALESSRIKEAQLKAAEFAIKRVIRKNGELWIRLNPNIPVTKKPLEVRMGKGKGAIKYSMARVRPGSIIIEIKTPNEILARKAYKIASSKLPLKTSFIVSEK